MWFFDRANTKILKSLSSPSLVLKEQQANIERGSLQFVYIQWKSIPTIQAYTRM